MLSTLVAVALTEATFGSGVDPIWLDEVECTGEETRLEDCPANPIGVHNCGHSEDAGVRCSGIVTSISNEVRTPFYIS